MAWLKKDAKNEMEGLMFKPLDDDEEEEFRAWARRQFNMAHYEAPNPFWHPVVRNEWEKLAEEFFPAGINQTP
jgi:hypothetical protein